MESFFIQKLLPYIVNVLNEIQAYDVCEAQTSSSLPVSSFEIF